MKTNYNNLLSEKVSEIILTMRQIFKGINNNIYNELTEEYEEEMLGLCRLVPKNWSRGVYYSFCVFMEVIDAIDWEKIATTIEKYPVARIWFDVDTFKLFKDKIIGRSEYPDDIKKRVMAITERFFPVFQGVNELIKNPTPYMNRFVLLRKLEHENENILKQLI